VTNANAVQGCPRRDDSGSTRKPALFQWCTMTNECVWGVTCVRYRLAFLAYAISNIGNWFTFVATIAVSQPRKWR
jgi:hypothetical protein